jgi:hypothetical protein
MKGVKENKHALVWRIEGLKEIPPKLTMLINPANLDISYSQLINETRTMGGFVQEFWGEQLTSVSASGTTAMAYDQNGLTRKNLKQSESYINFNNLVNFYKNNGKVYSTKGSNRIVSFGTVVLTYFGKEYEGHFESFNVDESADTPFSLAYSFDFKVTRIIGDLAVIDGNFLRNEI